MNVKILFARVWGVLAILFGLLFSVIAIYNFLKVGSTSEDLLIYIALFGGGVMFIFVGCFFLFTKMSDK